MCTISYIPNKNYNSFTFTHNRDESIHRLAEMPTFHKEDGTKLYYPKDKEAGGTWIGVSNKKRLIGIMNGAFSQHKRKKSYRKSRGVMVKELLAAHSLTDQLKDYNFKGIEAFFCIVISWNKKIQVHELIWDEEKIYFHQKNEKENHIWSSMMSFSIAQHQEKEKVFHAFIAEKKEITPAMIWELHHRTGEEGESNFLVDKGNLKTTSISQLEYASTGSWFKQEDIITGKMQNHCIF